VAVGNDNSLQAIAFYCLMFGIGGIFFTVITCCYYKRFHYSLFGENLQNTRHILPIANTDIVHDNIPVLSSVVYTQELLQPCHTNIKNEELPLALALPVV
jgi:hypothetical protein